MQEYVFVVVGCYSNYCIIEGLQVKFIYKFSLFYKHSNNNKNNKNQLQ